MGMRYVKRKMSDVKKFYQFKLPHGWFGGGWKETDVICTIDAGVSMWHTLIMEELVESNEIIESSYQKQDEERISVGIRQGLDRHISKDDISPGNCAARHCPYDKDIDRCRSD